MVTLLGKAAKVNYKNLSDYPVKKATNFLYPTLERLPFAWNQLYKLWLD